MQQVRDGNAAQLGTLFERHHQPLYNFFRRLTGSSTTSEDLVQEVFLRILKYRHTYRGEGSFRVWMYQIARNARTDHFRKRRHEGPVPDEPPDLPSHDPDAGDVVERDQQHALLRAALDRLPEEKREVLVLSRFHDMRYEEIADVVGCSVGAVKVRVHRAMKELRIAYYKLAKDQVV
jgi:RNA polymerase sigma-70 factor (ECF subfamily)